MGNRYTTTAGIVRIVRAEKEKMEIKENNNKKLEADVIRILSCISFSRYEFKFCIDGTKWYLQAEYQEPDVVTGKVEIQKTRKWILSPYMTKSEIVQTAFKCALTSMEHRTREHFLYKGERIFSPHYDCEELVKLCRSGKFDEREDWYAEGNTKNTLEERLEFAAKHTE